MFLLAAVPYQFFEEALLGRASPALVVAMLYAMPNLDDVLLQGTLMDRLTGYPFFLSAARARQELKRAKVLVWRRVGGVRIVHRDPVTFGRPFDVVLPALPVLRPGGPKGHEVVAHLFREVTRQFNVGRPDLPRPKRQPRQQVDRAAGDDRSEL